MSISLYSAFKLGATIASLCKDAPNNKIARNSVNAASRVFETIHEESSIREGLICARIHLETAYENYKPWTWDIWDAERVLWGKKTFKNTIVLCIAIIHHMLGNDSIAKKWLVEELDSWGSIYFPAEGLLALDISNPNEFYESINCATEVRKIMSESESNWHSAYDSTASDDYYNYYNGHYD